MGAEGKRRLRLRHMTNDELVKHYDNNLILRLHNKKDLADTKKMPGSLLPTSTACRRPQSSPKIS